MSQLQMLKGGKRADRTEEARLDPADMPKPTMRLTGHGAREWSRLAPELYSTGRLTTLDAGLFTAYCKAYGQYKEAELRLERARTDPNKEDGYREGGLFKTFQGNLIPHPLVGACNTARESCLKLGKEFGLTPASRVNIDANKRPDDDPRNSKYF